MWTVENRARYDRSRLRYPSDLTDEVWALVRPKIPRAKRACRRCPGSRWRGSGDGDVFGLHAFLLKLYADAGYQGPKFQQGLARAYREVKVEIVRRCDTGKFVVLPKRLRRSAPNRRTHHRLAEPLPAPEKGLGVPQAKRHHPPPLGVGSTDAAKALPFIEMILDGLLHLNRSRGWGPISSAD
jgi:transposase